MAIQKCANQRINLVWQFVRELEASFQLHKSQFSTPIMLRSPGDLGEAPGKLTFSMQARNKLVGQLVYVNMLETEYWLNG